MAERRFLTQAEAADYLGVSADTFGQEVEAGMWPPPLRRGATGRRLTWDRKRLDAAADALAGFCQALPAAATAEPPSVAPAPPLPAVAGQPSGETKLLHRIASRHDGKVTAPLPATAIAGGGRSRRA